MGFIYLFLPGRRGSGSSGHIATRQSKLPAIFCSQSACKILHKFSAAMRRGKVRVCDFGPRVSSFRAGRDQARGPRAPLALRRAENSRRLSPLRSIILRGRRGQGRGPSPGARPSELESPGRPPFCRDGSDATRAGLRPRQKGQPGLRASLPRPRQRRHRKCSRQDPGALHASRITGTQRSHPRPPRVSHGQGRAPSAVTNFRVCSLTVCLSYELVHLYLLL